MWCRGWERVKVGWWGKGSRGMEVKIDCGDGEDVGGEMMWGGSKLMVGY